MKKVLVLLLSLTILSCSSSSNNDDRYEHTCKWLMDIKTFEFYEVCD